MPKPVNFSDNSKNNLQVIYRPIAKVLGAARNARTHSQQQISQIVRSIAEFGWTNPILVDEGGTIIAGHGRLEAAKVLRMAQVPTITLAGLSAEQKRALAIADNKLALNAGWDDEALRLELEELKGLDFDLSMIGFSDEELAGILDTNMGLTDPDDAPEPPVDPVSRLGDVWLLGRHRLVCGDSTDAGAVERCLAGVKPHLMVTDPPYGVEYDAVHARETNRAHGAVTNDDRADWREAWALFPGSVAYVWHAGLRAREVVESLEASDFVMRAQIIWDKTRLIMSRGHYHFQHEPCWYAVRKGSTGHWSGDRRQLTVWAIHHPRSETGHSTQKPIECMKRPIENNSSPGQAVYEPFSGSGTTLIAGEMTGRSVLAIEIAPAYVDCAVIRWQNFTGLEATHETGATFAQMKEERTLVAAA